MRKLLSLTFVPLVLMTCLLDGLPLRALAFASPAGFQDQNTEPPRVMTVPGARRRRRVRGDRPRHRGIGGSFAEAGRSAGRGGKRLGQNVADGRPVRGGKYFGKGMGGFGKHVGIGTGKVGQRIGRSTKRALTP